MARSLRLEFPGAIYHVTSRGNARNAIFIDDEDRGLFLGCLGEVVARFDWLCHAYCLMDNQLSSAYRDAGSQPVAGHAPIERCLYAAF